MVSFIVPSKGRPSLLRTLNSIELWPGDEVIVVGELISIEPFIRSEDLARGVRVIQCDRGNDWGSTERNRVMPLAQGEYLSFMDDDDIYAPGHRAAMQNAMEQTPGRPVIFRMQFPNGITLWYHNDRDVRCGNVGTPMIFVPNVPEKLGTWGSRWGGDFDFMNSLKWNKDEIVWREEVIALLGHNP